MRKVAHTLQFAFSQASKLIAITTTDRFGNLCYKMKAKYLAAFIALGITTCVAVTFIALYVTEVSDDPVNVYKYCGGVLEGDNGTLEHVFSSDDGTSSCLWIIRLAHGNGMRITVKRLTTTMSVYTEQRGVDGSLLPTV